MAKSKIDPIGRAVGEGAQEAYDSKLYDPADNLASNSDIAANAGKHVANFISSAEFNRTYLLDKMSVLYALWNGDPISRYYPSARSVHVPEPYKAVESVVGRLFDILVGAPKWFRIVGLDDSGRKNAEVVTDLILEQLRQDGWKRKVPSIFRDICIYGWKVAKLRWKTCRREIKYNKVTETPIMEGETQTGSKVDIKRGEVETVNLDGPTVEPIDNMDVFVDIRFHDLQNEAPGVAIRQEIFEEQLLAGEKAGWYKNVKALMDPLQHPSGADTQVMGPQGTALTISTYKQVRDYSDGIALDFTSQTPPSRRYELYEFYGKFDPTQDIGGPGKTDYASSADVGKRGVQGEYMITLARKIGQASEMSQGGGWTVLSVVKNPWWHGQRPLVDGHYTRRSHVFHSMGIIEPIMKLSVELDDSRNMALQARALAAKPIIIASDQADIYSNNMILDPGSVIRARTTDAIQALRIPDVSDAAYKAESAIKQDIHETTGVIPLYMGAEKSGSETATGTVSRIREANKRLGEAARNISENMLIPMLEQIFSMNQQMITEERMVEIIGEDGLVENVRKVGPADVAGRMRFEILAMPQIEMAGIQAQMYTNYLNTAASVEQMVPGTFNLAKLAQKAWEKQFGTNEVNEIFPNAGIPRKMRNTNKEHMLIAYGQALLPQEGENYRIHMAGHDAFMKTSTYANWGEDAKRRMIAHRENTMMAEQAFMEENVLPEIPPQMMQPPPGGPQGGPPGGAQGGPPKPPQQGGGATPIGQVRSNAAAMAPRTPRGQ